MHGNRTDGVNLIKEWEKLHAGQSYCTVLKFSDLDKCDPDDVDYMFGRSPYQTNLLVDVIIDLFFL